MRLAGGAAQLPLKLPDHCTIPFDLRRRRWRHPPRLPADLPIPCRPPAGLAMFISGMVLWRTEGTHALIGLWVLGLLVFIPGFYYT